MAAQQSQSIVLQPWSTVAVQLRERQREREEGGAKRWSLFHLSSREGWPDTQARTHTHSQREDMKRGQGANGREMVLSKKGG